MKKIKALLLILVFITSVSNFIAAQQSHINLDWAPQRNTQNLKPFGASVISPEVADDGMVTFRVAAPEAREISLSGNVLLGLGVSKPVPFTKGEDGIWTLKVGPIEPEIYYYKLIIDGVSVDDPSNNLTGFAGQPGFRILVVHGEGPAFYVYNVHLDHISQPSREKSVALLLERIGSRDPKAPAVVTGDFNAGESNAAAAAMRTVFADTFRLLHPDTAEAGTFNGFKPGQVGGDKIDFVFVEPGTEVLAAEIVRAARDGRYPSDHFPVSARIRLR